MLGGEAQRRFAPPGLRWRKQSVQSKEGQDSENNYHGSYQPDYVVHGSCPPIVETFRIARSSACRPRPDPTDERHLRSNNREERSVSGDHANRLGNGGSQPRRHVWTGSRLAPYGLANERDGVSVARQRQKSGKPDSNGAQIVLLRTRNPSDAIRSDCLRPD